jgi:hypothetical protein
VSGWTLCSRLPTGWCGSLMACVLAGHRGVGVAEEGSAQLEVALPSSPIGDVGDIARLRSKAHFASWTGTAPIDASSGQQQRHRLSRAGNRRLNRVLHIMAIVQIRHDTEGRDYYRRKLATGKTHPWKHSGA